MASRTALLAQTMQSSRGRGGVSKLRDSNVLCQGLICFASDVERHRRDCGKWTDGSDVYGGDREGDGGVGGAATCGASAGGVAEAEAAAVVRVPAPGLQHPCIACMVEEDDAGHEDGEQSFCRGCGTFFCKQCQTKVLKKEIIECHSCKSSFYGSRVYEFTLLLKLVNDRPPGRHTVHAHYGLGYMYCTGAGYVTKNNTEAAKWYLLAAKAGSARAQYCIASMYLNGSGVPEDVAEAVKWFRLSAAQDFSRAQHDLGQAFVKHHIKPEGKPEKKQWKKWATMKDPRAAPPLRGSRDDSARDGGGSAYAAPTPTAPPPPPPTNRVAAPGLQHPCAECMLQEEDAGYEDVGLKEIIQAMCFSCGAFHCRACNVKLRNKEITKCQSCQAPVPSTDEAEFKQLESLVHDKLPGRHTPQAHYELSVRYEMGLGVKRNALASVKWIRSAAEQGQPEALFNLSNLHFIGRDGVKKDLAKSNNFLKLSAAFSYKPAQFQIGQLFLNKKIKTKDKAEKKLWKKWSRMAEP